MSAAPDCHLSTPDLLVAEALSFARGGVPILAGVGLSASAGERVAVAGPSGSGKTTLLTLLAGVQRPDQGRVLLAGEPLRRPGPSIALVLQGYGLLPLLTAAENVEVSLRAAGVPAADAIDRAGTALAAVDVEDHADRLVQELSGGQQQRVAIARALALAPRVLLADEPTAEQDPSHRQLVVDRLIEVAEGGALILATHDLAIAASCDRIIHLHNGRLVG